MPLIDDRLTPRDGLNNYAIAFARMQPQPQTRGGAEFVFAISDSMQPVCELSVTMVARGQGLDQMMVEAHDAVIDILRQLVFRADKSRSGYERFIRPASVMDCDELNEVELL
ncbi:MAG TPA: hypothetical protein VMB71_01925 [Acetobacteraceae bacterium]|nr:hypothetical protein [Acetobacteraceae bacterium]